MSSLRDHIERTLPETDRVTAVETGSIAVVGSSALPHAE